MPGISHRPAEKPVKLLLLGQSGSGKTGSLASLAEAGYNLRILDFDEGTPILQDLCTNPKSPYKVPEPDQRIQYVTLTDKMKPMGDRVICQSATAWPRAIKLLGDWTDGETKLGKLSDWTSQEILVVDSLTMLSTAALHYHLSMQGALLNPRTQNEGRRDVYAAQSMIRSLLEMLYSDGIKCNVIMMSHITYNTEEGTKPDPAKPDEIMSKQGFPAAIGRALGPEIPRFFNSMLIAKTEGIAQAAPRYIYTVPVDAINAKSSAPLRVEKKYKLATGLAEYFKAVKGV